MKSVDIFADTNPAYCSIVLYQFCSGYLVEAKEDVEYPLLILPIPLVLSGELERTFESTRVDTGFFTWIDRNPQILVSFADRVQGCVFLTKAAVEFAIAYSLFEVSSIGKIHPNVNVLRKKVPPPTTKTGRVFRNAYRLGQWLGQVRSTPTVFNHLGLVL